MIIDINLYIECNIYVNYNAVSICDFCMNVDDLIIQFDGFLFNFLSQHM